MKILILTDELPEDILNFNVDLLVNANYFSKKGHEVYLASHGRKHINQGKFHHLPLSKTSDKHKDSIDSFITRNLTFFLAMLKKIKKISPDLILCVGGGQYLCNFSTGLLLSKLTNIPMISEWRGSELLLKNNACRRISKKTILKNSTVNIVRSDQMKNFALQLSSRSEIIISPSKGVDIDHFEPKSDKIPSDLVNILYVGRLHEIKGLTYLIDAFLDLHKKHHDTRLTIVGKGDLKDELIERVKTAGFSDDVKFVGEIDHRKLPTYYGKADIFVLPSLSEGLSNVVMEAMASGLPVIATDVGGNSELIKDGSGGSVVEPRDTKELCSAMERLCSDELLRKKMGEYNRKKIKKYEQEKVLSKKLKLIQKVVDQT